MVLLVLHRVLRRHSQADLLAHFEKDFGNQIIYTTHSPFMVPVHKLDAVRTASLGETSGTTVSNTAEGDERTLFPLKAALALSRMASEPVKVEAAKPVAAKAVAGEVTKPAKVAKPVDAVVAVAAAPAVAAEATVEPAPVGAVVEPADSELTQAA